MNNIVRFDTKITNHIRSLPRWVKPLMQAATFTGNIFPVFMALLICYLFGSVNTRLAIAFIGVATLLNAALKQFIHRPRPDTLYVSRMRFKTQSFPSGHAFGTVTTYGFIAYLSAAHLSQPLTIIIQLLLCLLIFLVGVSRVYLGAHYPTDVIGGWILGLICLFGAIALI
jgi:undecaprenyl-diphosphatase